MAKTKQEQIEVEKKKLLKKVETIEKKITDLNRPQPIGFRFGTKSKNNG
jgi:hypothetical protein